MAGGEGAAGWDEALVGVGASPGPHTQKHTGPPELSEWSRIDEGYPHGGMRQKWVFYSH